MKNASDSQIFGMIVSEGSLPAFAELFERYWQRLYVKAYARLENADDAKDCVQDVFITIWTKREGLTMPVSVSGYLQAAVKNRVFNIFHARLTDQRHMIAYAYETQCHEEPDAHSMSFEELALLIEREVSCMPEQMRKIYLLSREQQMSGVQIAEHLALSPQTVRNQISNALKRIRERIEHYRNA
ncbi:MAG TPA: RNA polymerase sigma-70 factor [Dyadobacter sp.]|nr:RNA polymerase sigma-70 factor [Dyadobacter sp.]